MSEWLPFVVVGVFTGSIYALAAMGLVLTFRTSGIFNFAHGAQAAMGAFVMFEFRERIGLAWPIAFLYSLLLTGVIAGLLLERLAELLAPVGTASRVTATVGLTVAVQATIVAIFGAAALRMEHFLPTRDVRIGGVNVQYQQIIVTFFVLGALGGLYWFLNRSRTGVATQAVVDDPTLLGLMAISPSTVRRLSWVLGSSFAATSGMLLAPTIGLDAAVLTNLVFFAFGAAAVGRFQSLPLTYLGGMGIGLGAALLTKLLNTTSAIAALPSSLPFIVLFAVLLLTRPEKLVERGAAVLRTTAPPMRFSRRAVTSAAVGLTGFLVVLPSWTDRLPVFSSALGFVILFASLSMLVRMSAQISLCHMTFAATGAAAFLHATKAGIPWLVAVLLAGLAAIPMGAIVAIPAIRTSGVFLAIATFGFALVVQRLLFPSFLMFPFSADLSAPRPDLLGLNTDTDTGYYYVMLVGAALCCGLVLTVQRSRLGRLLRGLADNPDAIDAHGTSTNVTRVLVFCLSAFMAGVGGAMLGPVTGTVTPISFDFSLSLLLVAVLFIAGRQPIAGPIMAAALLIVLPGYLTGEFATRYIQVFFGIGAVVASTAGGVPLLRRRMASKVVANRMTRRSRGEARRRMGALEVST